MAELETIPFVTGHTTFRLTNGFEIDLMSLPLKGLEGISFDTLLKMSSLASIHELTVPFLHIDHLIANKEAAGTLKDRDDAEQLRRLRLLREKDGRLTRSNVQGIRPDTYSPQTHSEISV